MQSPSTQALKKQFTQVELMHKMQALRKKQAYQIKLRRQEYFFLLVPNYFNNNLSSIGCNISIAQALKLKEFITKEFHD
jgi:hypothetical protein